MITATTTVANMLGMIKRRCGASQAISELASKSTELVGKIRELLMTLEEGSQGLPDKIGISTALNNRREEFVAGLQNLENMEGHTKCTNAIDRTERFIMAQGWAKRMEAIHNDLIHLRAGIETIASSWDVAKLVLNVKKTVANDLAEMMESSRFTVRREQHGEKNSSHTTMVDHAGGNEMPFKWYGNPNSLSIPNQQCEASDWVDSTDETWYQFCKRTTYSYKPYLMQLLDS